MGWGKATASSRAEAVSSIVADVTEAVTGEVEENHSSRIICGVTSLQKMKDGSSYPEEVHVLDERMRNT